MICDPTLAEIERLREQNRRLRAAIKRVKAECNERIQREWLKGTEAQDVYKQRAEKAEATIAEMLYFRRSSHE